MNEAEQERIARAVLERAGGRKNITKAYHCMTRLRLELAGGITEGLKAQLAAIPGVLGTNVSGSEGRCVIDAIAYKGKLRAAS